LAAALHARAWGATVEVRNDTFAILRAGVADPRGVAVVCGAGINCVGMRPDGRTARFPAIGRISGDWGGGWGLAEEALWFAARAEDGRGEPTELTRTLPAHFGLDSMYALIEALHLERIEQVRQKHKAAFRKAEGASLTYLPFIARAICDALRTFPTMNSSLDMASKTMKLHHFVNLAIAVDVNEQGLMAPVIFDADTLNLRGMARAIKRVGDAAKNKTLKANEMSGSTFTISNPGPLGTYASAAIINQPNVGIITTEGVARRVVATGDDAIAIHHTCVLGLSYDHRALDGVTAARFLGYIRDALQQRDWEAELA
jgi:hypothetical protein